MLLNASLAAQLAGRGRWERIQFVFLTVCLLYSRTITSICILGVFRPMSFLPAQLLPLHAEICIGWHLDLHTKTVSPFNRDFWACVANCDWCQAKDWSKTSWSVSLIIKASFTVCTLKERLIFSIPPSSS